MLPRCAYIRKGMQTLGEEYTNIWQYSGASGLPPSRWMRLGVVLLPTLPSYLLARGTTWMSSPSALLKRLPTILGVLVEMNLALFYFSGTYYHLIKRFLGVRYASPFCVLSRV